MLVLRIQYKSISASLKLLARWFIRHQDRERERAWRDDGIIRNIDIGFLERDGKRALATTMRRAMSAVCGHRMTTRDHRSSLLPLCRATSESTKRRTGRTWLLFLIERKLASRAENSFANFAKHTAALKRAASRFRPNDCRVLRSPLAAFRLRNKDKRQ